MKNEGKKTTIDQVKYKHMVEEKDEEKYMQEDKQKKAEKIKRKKDLNTLSSTRLELGVSKATQHCLHQA